MKIRTQKHFVCPAPSSSPSSTSASASASASEDKQNVLARWLRRTITEPVTRTAHAFGRAALAPERFM